MNNESPAHLQAPDTALSRMMASEPGLSVVVPVYRGATTIGHPVQALAALEPQGGMEIVLVNDGSPDNSAEACMALVARPGAPITYIEHARSYDEHNAVMIGLRHAAGRFVITMDVDLQNPPDEVVRLYDHARLGNWDVVYARYENKWHAGWRNLGSTFLSANGKPQGTVRNVLRNAAAEQYRL